MTIRLVCFAMKRSFSIAWAAVIAFTLVSEPVSAQGRTQPGAAARAQGAPPRAAGTVPRAPGATHRPHTAHAPVHRPAYHPRARVGVYFGAPFYASPWWGYPDPFFYPYYPYGPYYGLPPVPVYEEPPVYIEQAAPPAPQPPQYWYYCEDSKTYYPYVQTCATPWVRVIPHAPPHAPQ
jgi:hypothetical protein